MTQFNRTQFKINLIELECHGEYQVFHENSIQKIIQFQNLIELECQVLDKLFGSDFGSNHYNDNSNWSSLKHIGL